MKKISDKCLEDFVKEGLTPPQIARACNMSRQAIHQRLNYKSKSAEKEKLTRELIKKGATAKQIQKELGHTSINTTYMYMRNIGVISPSKGEKYRRKAMVKFLLSKGFNLTEISKELNIPKATVWRLKGGSVKKMTNIRAKVPKKLWDSFKIKSIIQQKSTEDLIIELIKKEVGDDRIMPVLQPRRKKL